MATTDDVTPNIFGIFFSSLDVGEKKENWFFLLLLFVATFVVSCQAAITMEIFGKKLKRKLL